MEASSRCCVAVAESPVSYQSNRKIANKARHYAILLPYSSLASRRYSTRSMLRCADHGGNTLGHAEDELDVNRTENRANWTPMPEM